MHISVDVIVQHAYIPIIEQQMSDGVSEMNRTSMTVFDDQLIKDVADSVSDAMEDEMIRLRKIEAAAMDLFNSIHVENSDYSADNNDLEDFHDVIRLL